MIDNNILYRVFFLNYLMDLLFFLFQDKEIHILLEDQQKINQFARLNNRLDELKDDIKAKNNEIQTLKDASDDLMMLDDDEKVTLTFQFKVY